MEADLRICVFSVKDQLAGNKPNQNNELTGKSNVTLTYPAAECNCFVARNGKKRFEDSHPSIDP